MNPNLVPLSKDSSFKLQLPKPLDPPALLNSATPLPDFIDKKDPLAVGIYYHESGQYQLSAYYFSIAAANGDPTGLFLFAISMRHGWGMAKDEEQAFAMVINDLKIAISVY
jgi:TPR repeat protein